MTSDWWADVRFATHFRTQNRASRRAPQCANFGRELPLFLRGLLYIRESLDRRTRGQAFQPGHGMLNRFMTAQPTVATRRWGLPAIVTLASMAALTALTAGAAARQARPAQPTEATAPREAG